MEMFEEIYEVRKELPKFTTVINHLKKQKFNNYQYFTFAIGVVLFILGIILGNTFPACGGTLSFYNDVCVSTEFNVLLMVSSWFVSFILCMFLYGIGEIIRNLVEINGKLIKSK